MELEGHSGLGFTVVDPRLSAGRGEQFTNAYQVRSKILAMYRAECVLFRASLCPLAPPRRRSHARASPCAQERQQRQGQEQEGGWGDFLEPGEDGAGAQEVAADLNTGKPGHAGGRCARLLRAWPTLTRTPCTRHRDAEIPESNVGFKLLQKMGWSRGRGLGRNENGER